MNTLMITSSYHQVFISTGTKLRVLNNFLKTLWVISAQSMTINLPRKPTVLEKGFKAEELFSHNLNYLSSVQVLLKKSCIYWLQSGKKDSAFLLLLSLLKLPQQCLLFLNMQNLWKIMQNLLELRSLSNIAWLKSQKTRLFLNILSQGKEWRKSLIFCTWFHQWALHHLFLNQVWQTWQGS